jgi:predicted DNA-binding transcriptional regulator YafY
MRADRLLSILMILQGRGASTASALAEELEVSVRTIYRDLEALTMSGVPIHTERGRGGGCALARGYRSNLTGLTDEEVQALFMLSIPTALADLGLGPKLTAALRKLSASLPVERRRSRAFVRKRVHLDWSPGTPAEESTAHLKTVQRAVWEDRRLRLSYRLAYGSWRDQFERVVDALGLVSHAGIWHLVCADGARTRVYRISQLMEVALIDETFERPIDFDLEACWTAWCAVRDGGFPPFVTKVRVSPTLLDELPQHFGEPLRERIGQAEPPDGEGWITMELAFDSLPSARTRILGVGGAIEVLEPASLRRSIADFALQVAGIYRPQSCWPPGEVASVNGG